MQKNNKYIEWALSVLLVVAVFWFWFVPYKGLLNYHEQYQLFLFGTDYFIERVSVPGGFIDYVSEFLVQFFYIPLYGAIILAFLFLGLQRHTWMLCRDYGAGSWLYPLTFVPVFALWVIMSDENVLPTLPLSITAALVLSHIYNKIGGRATARVAPTGIVFLLLGIIGGYWLIGPSIFILTLYSLIKERHQLWLVLAILLVSILPPLLYGTILPYEMRRFFTGINYFRYPVYGLTAQFVVTALFAFIPLISGLKKDVVNAKRRRIKYIVLTLVVSVCGGVLVFGSYNSTKSDLIEYDYLIRTEQWSTLIRKAEKNPPRSPMGVSCLNLALSQKGQLTERLFEFFQNGGEGLLPQFVRDMTSPVPTAETYYRLGMVNTAHRFYYEAQECIPNHRKSGRFMKRLIECEIVNGQYEVARKWLRLLERSLFYSNWAKEKLAMLDNEKAVDIDPTVLSLRSKRETEDYLFSDAEVDQMLGMLFVKDKSNRMAYEYLMCYVLLEKDVERFMKYYHLGRYIGYRRIPSVFQEVLIGVCLQENSDPKAIPYKVDNRSLNNTMGFIRLYVNDQDNPALDSAPYNTNSWNYLLRGGGNNVKD